MSSKIVNVENNPLIYIKTTTKEIEGRYKSKISTIKQYVFKYYDVLGKKKQVTLPVNIKRIEEVIQRQKQKIKEVELEKKSLLKKAKEKKKVPDIISLEVEENKKQNRPLVFDDIATLYLNNHTHLKSHSKYVSIYTNHIKPTFETIEAYKLDDSDVTKFYTELCRKFSIKTSNDYIQLMKTFYNYAIKKKKFTSANPIIFVKIKNPNNQRTNSLKIEDIDLLLEDKRIKNNPDLYIFVLLATRTGARAGSIMNLKKTKVDLKTNTVTLFNYKKGNNAGDYKAFFDDRTKKVLKERVENCEKHEKIIISTYASLRKKLQRILDELFNYNDRDNSKDLDSKGRVKKPELFIYAPETLPITKKILYSSKGLRSSNQDLTEEQMIIRADRRKDRIVIHSLRHSFATYFLTQKGASIFKLKGLLDHSDISMTMRYSHQDDDENKKVVMNMYDRKED